MHDWRTGELGGLLDFSTWKKKQCGTYEDFAVGFAVFLVMLWDQQNRWGAGQRGPKKYELSWVQYLSFVDVQERNTKSLKSVEMLPLTLKSFPSSLALLISPPYTGTLLYSGMWVWTGQPCPSPWKVHRHQGWDLTPALDPHNPPLEKKTVETVQRVFAFFLFLTVHCSLWGSATLVLSPQVGQQRPTWSLGLRTACTLTQSFSIGLENIIINSSSQWGFCCWGF